MFSYIPLLSAYPEDYLLSQFNAAVRWLTQTIPILKSPAIRNIMYAFVLYMAYKHYGQRLLARVTRSYR